MSNQNSNTTQISRRLESVPLTGSLNLEIPDAILDKIEFLCRNINKVEWSGLLFYEVIGSIQDTDKMKIVCKDILLMDKGTAAYTEYNWDEDIVSYRMDNPDAIDWCVGHVHSHNTMTVYFSGTDWSELNDNSPLHNIYLSLIVNNFMEMTAKVAFTGLPTVFTCKDEQGKDYELPIQGGNYAPFMFTYDCNIVRSNRGVTVDKSFSQRYDEVISKFEQRQAAEEARKKAALLAAPKGVQPSYYGNNMSKTPLTQGKQNWSDNTHNKGEMGQTSDWGWPDTFDKQGEKNTPVFSERNFQRELEIEQGLLFSEEPIEITIEEQFASFVIRLGNTVEGDSLVDALEDLELANLSANSISKTILENYGLYYDSFFDGNNKFTGHKAFLTTLEYVISILQDEEETFGMTDKIIESLKLLGNRYEQSLKTTV